MVMAKGSDDGSLRRPWRKKGGREGFFLMVASYSPAARHEARSGPLENWALQCHLGSSSSSAGARRTRKGFPLGERREKKVTNEADQPTERAPLEPGAKPTDPTTPFPSFLHFPRAGRKKAIAAKIGLLTFQKWGEEEMESENEEGGRGVESTRGSFQDKATVLHNGGGWGGLPNQR